MSSRKKEKLSRTPKAKKGSAVLIPLAKINGELTILFERRSARLRTQPGEICLPGGAIEEGESAKKAAVRETMEELLIAKDQIEVLDAMDSVASPSGAPVWPYVAKVRRYKGTFSADEVDSVIAVPLSVLLAAEPEVHKVEMVSVPGEDFPYDLIPGGRDYPWHRKVRIMYFYRLPNLVIWGMTADVIRQFTEVYGDHFERTGKKPKKKNKKFANEG